MQSSGAPWAQGPQGTTALPQLCPKYQKERHSCEVLPELSGFTSVCCKMCAEASGYSVSHAPMILSAVLWHFYPHLCSSVRTVIQPFHSHTLSRLAGQECVFLNGGHKANCWQCVKGGRGSSTKTTGEVKFLQLLTVGSKKPQQQAHKFRTCWLSPTGIH